MKNHRVTKLGSVQMLITLSAAALAFSACAPKVGADIQRPEVVPSKPVKPGPDSGGSDKSALGQPQRLSVYKDLVGYVQGNYTFQHLKGKNLTAHFNQCTAVERSVNAKASGILGFEDRLRVCLAGVGDTFVRLTSTRPKLYTGLVLTEIGGKFFVQSLFAGQSFKDFYADKLNQADSTETVDIGEILKPGTEIVGLDGLAPSDLVKQFGSMVSASTPALRTQLATMALTQRDFSYPLRNFLRVDYLQAGTQKQKSLNLFWFKDGASDEHVAAETYLSDIEVKDFSEQFPDVQAGIAGEYQDGWLGYRSSAPLVREGLREFTDIQAALPAFRFAEIGSQTCYLQILRLNKGNLVSEDRTVSTETALKEIFAQCESEKRGLILDLRTLQAVNDEIAGLLMSHLARKDQPVPPLFYTGLMTTHFRKTNLNFKPKPGVPTPVGRFFDWKIAADAAEIAAKDRKQYLPLVHSKLIAPALQEGFNQKLAVLISSQCVGVCDLIATYVKAQNRGTLIGSATSGSFGLFAKDAKTFTRKIEFKSGDEVRSFEMFSITVPSALIGLNKEVPKTAPGFQDFDSKLHNPEGQSVLPSEGQVYIVDLNELQTGESGYLKRALEVLSSSN